MADNTVLSAKIGTGDTIATDDITDAGVADGAKVQRIKAGFGSDNNYADPTGNTGTVDAGTARVTLATDVALPAGTNAIGKLAANSGVDIGDVDVLSVAGTVTVDNGGTFAVQDSTVATNTTDLPNVIGTDGGAAPSKAVSVAGTDSGTGFLQEISVDSSGNVQTDIVGSLPAGTNAIGKLAANSGVDIGDVDVLSVAGTVTVDNGGTFAVQDATVATNTTDLPNVIGTDGSAGPTKAVSIAGTDSGTLREVSVDASGNVQADIVGSLPAGTAAIGKLAANSGVDIGDVDVLSVAGTVTVDNGGTFAVQDATLATNTTDLPNVIGTDGSAGPTKAISIAGTDTGTLREVHVDSSGNVGVDIQVASVSVPVRGSAAHAQPAAGNPLQAGFRANGTEPSAVSNNDITYPWADLQGRLVTVQGHPAAAASSTHGPKSTQLNGTTTETTVVSGVALNSIYVTAISCTNTSSTYSTITMRDDASATAVWVMGLAPDGGGFVQEFHPPWKLGTGTASNLTAQCSASVDSVWVNVHFFVAA